MSAPRVLEVNDLYAAYGNATALHGVSLVVEEGETVALLGANGAGKSTMLRTISGLLPARSGSISWCGETITNLAADRIVGLGISHCPEERHIWPEMTVAENVSLGGYLCRDRRELERREALAFDRFPRLKERSGQLAGTLSGGEQQMLAIARALMSEPKLLMLDEPSLGLSPKMAEDVFTVIRDINRHGITVLLVEQNVQNALGVASRAYVLETGRITAEREAEALRNDPELVRSYLGG